MRVSNLGSAFTSAGALSSCNQRSIYLAWGATLQAAYPPWPTCTIGTQCTTCITNSNVGTAVTAWGTNPTTAVATYGNIADWDVSAVSNMYQLFYNKPTFNADISKWNTASVRAPRPFICTLHFVICNALGDEFVSKLPRSERIQRGH